MASDPLPQRPFTDPTGSDVILRSADGVDFYAHKIVLSIASPFFEGMFSAQQLGDTRPGTIEAVPFVESSRVLECMLRLTYPVHDPALNSFDDVVEVLEASLKYEMLQAVRILKTNLQEYTPSRSLDVFATACRLRLEREAEIAASVWRKEHHWIDAPSNWETSMEGMTYSPAMDQICAGSLYRLLEYTRNGTLPPSFLYPPPSAKADMPVPEAVQSPYTFDDADFIVKSFDDVEFRVHKHTIYLASANKLDGAPIMSESGSLPTVILAEPGTVIRGLLQLCYPIEDSDPRHLDLSTVHAVLSAAIKYAMKAAVARLRRTVMSHEKKEPVRVYFIAAKIGWKEGALRAARQLGVRNLPIAYVPEMELVPATPYHRLLKFRHRTCTVRAENREKYFTKPNGAIQSYLEYIEMNSPIPDYPSQFQSKRKGRRYCNEQKEVHPETVPDHKRALYLDAFQKLFAECKDMSRQFKAEVSEIELEF